MSMLMAPGRARVDAHGRTHRCRSVAPRKRYGVAWRGSDLTAPNSLDGGLIAVRPLESLLSANFGRV
jgi:hypothetical protein